jgi:hypothetical protein
MLMNWLSLTAKNDVVAVALIVTLAVLGILFASLFFGRQVETKVAPKARERSVDEVSVPMSL